MHQSAEGVRTLYAVRSHAAPDVRNVYCGTIKDNALREETGTYIWDVVVP